VNLLRCFLRCLAAALFFLYVPASAQSTSDGSVENNKKTEQANHSPWLFVPLVSSSPKLGTSLGVMGGYIHRFDEVSSPSLVGMQGMRSNTSSSVLSAGGKLFFNENKDRVAFGLVGGKVSNDYLDFLGTGTEVRTEEQLRAYFLRYQHEVAPHWFFGIQGTRSNYGVEGEDFVSDTALEQAGLAGITSAGLGLALSYDTRDNVNNPSSGIYWMLHNLAYRQGFGSDDNYDALNTDFRWYQRTSEKNVVVLHAKARWTDDAPASRESTIMMRGYTHGQYMGQNSVTMEAENRYMIYPRVGAKAFGGLACIYGDGKSCSGDNLYPMAGVGAFYILKPKENMVVTAEYAKGNGDNEGFYLRFGNRF
jgi:outer membrane protein assembly factor BamA